MLPFEAVQTQNTDLKEQTASRDSWPAVTHIGRIRLNKSYKVNVGVGVKEPWGGTTLSNTERSKERGCCFSL